MYACVLGMNKTCMYVCWGMWNSIYVCVHECVCVMYMCWGIWNMYVCWDVWNSMHVCMSMCVLCM